LFYIRAMPPSPPVVLSIAGFDPGSGAGTTADIKTAAAHGCYGIACITAITVQSTQGVRRVELLPAKLVREVLNELAGDFDIAAIRIGMLGSGEIVDVVHDFLAAHRYGNVVLDPIRAASSGTLLLDEKGQQKIKKLFPLSTVITPNTDEAAALTGLTVKTVEEMHAAASALHRMGAKNVIVTGGHLDKPLDLLSLDTPGAQEQHRFTSERVKSDSTHGTGCAFATALACALAQGKSLADAAVLAKAFVSNAIMRAKKVGKGVGPVHHLYRMDEQPRPVMATVAEREH
jgi:hydroxymethylpyrimidine/phosphomethylpyrimidine kinase